MIEQAIPSLLAGLIGCCIIKIDMIVRGMLGSEVSVPLIITCAEITTVCMRDDVIIVNVQVVISVWPVAVIERKTRSHGVNKFSGVDGITPTISIRVVRSF